MGMLCVHKGLCPVVYGHDKLYVEGNLMRTVGTKTIADLEKGSQEKCRFYCGLGPVWN